jgi:5-methylthioribose kinase
MLTTPEDVRRYMLAHGWIAADTPVRIEALSGGVSNQLWKIAGPDFRWVMKQALPKLKVRADWYSDVRRIERERAAMVALAPLLGAESVPQVLYADEAEHVYVMTCAPEGAVPWKQQLMRGRFDRETARRAGALLGRLHGLSAAQADAWREPFGDLTYFRELRLDPFHRHVMARHPDLRRPLETLIAQLTEADVCLVHGDYSPKNILVAPDGRLILLDYEVAHRGNPLFDVSFCIAHLMLKGWALDRREEAAALIGEFLAGYARDAGGLLPHLGALLLARIDGKSPVEYIADERLRERVRTVGGRWVRLAGEPAESGPRERMLQEIRQGLER